MPANLHQFRAPQTLDWSGHGASKALLIGSCTVLNTQEAFKVDHGIDSEFAHISSLQNLDFDTIDGPFDFQLVNVPADNINKRHEYFQDDLNSLDAARARFERACATIDEMLPAALKLNVDKGLTTFICNFCVPQMNPQGRLLPRYDLRNPIFFVEQVNRHLADQLGKYQNTYLVDIDSVVATFGRMRIQDDSIWSISHGGSFSDLDYLLAQKFVEAGHARVEPVLPVQEATFADRSLFWKIVAQEVVASYKSVRQRDQVKLVVVDLDDTMWRGIAADPVIDDPFDMLEGLPFGLIEALLYLESRGVALAIVSKNDEDKIREIWKRLMHRHIPLERFVSIKINWQSKAENIAAIATELNIGLDSVVFVDDHPREREEVIARLPAVRVLGSDVYAVRRELLWSPETQVRAITAESKRKTEMFRQQIARGTEMRSRSRDEFLGSLDLRVGLQVITRPTDRGYDRAVELINKTNQFNTTGIRWPNEAIVEVLSNGGYLVAFSASDKTTDYGIIAIGLMNACRIEIFVMSCRVIGLDIEIAALRKLEELAASHGEQLVEALTIITDRNGPSRDLFKRAGYAQDGDVWRRDLSVLGAVPSHIIVEKSVLA